MTDADYWRCVALYLADCHAANATYDGTLKSTSKVRRDRFAAICTKALSFIERAGMPYTRTLDDEARIVARLREGAAIGSKS